MFYYRMNVHSVQVLSSYGRKIKAVMNAVSAAKIFGRELFRRLLMAS